LKGGEKGENPQTRFFPHYFKELYPCSYDTKDQLAGVTDLGGIGKIRPMQELPLSWH